MFYPTRGLSTGARSPLKVDSQGFQAGFSEFVENSLWEMEQIVMATIHIVGGNNNRDPWNELPGGDLTDARVDEYEKRDMATRAWLDKTFAMAESHQAKGVLLFTQGDMWASYELASGLPRNGFDSCAQRLARLAAKFAKPVWLFNGDTHNFVELEPFTPGATHPLTKFQGKPDMSAYRIHGEEYDAPLFRAITVETIEKWDNAESHDDFDPNVQFEWIEVKLRPDTDEVFELVRRRVFKE